MKRFADEYDYLIHLIRCTIHNEKPEEIPVDFSFAKVYEYSVAHEIANIAFYSVDKLNNKPDDELYNKWFAKCNLAISRDINQSYARQEILDEFQKANIRSLEVQGTRIKGLYPKSEYRTMSDIDFIIDLSNLDMANEILIKLGYKCKKNNGVEVDGYRKPNIVVEVHTEYFPETSRFKDYMEAPFTDDGKMTDYIYEANTNTFYLYSILHIAKHFFDYGCGIRRILDVYFLRLKYAELLDYDYLDKNFEAAGITEFVKDIISLSEMWFGDGKNNKDLSELAMLIKKSELHGTMYVGIYNAWKDEAKQGKQLNEFKFKYVLRRILPDKDYMCRAYPIVKKHMFLIPVVWVYRIIRVVFTKQKNRIVSEIKILFKSRFSEHN